MKCVWLSVPFVFTAFLLAATPASAWYCRANSSDGHYGWASYFNRREAVRVALSECAQRTRYPLSCRIVNCVPD